MTVIVRKAIKTTFCGPTDRRGSRIRASDTDGNYCYLPWEHALDAIGNHRMAAKMLARRMKWDGKLITGGLKDCYVHVFTEEV